MYGQNYFLYAQAILQIMNFTTNHDRWWSQVHRKKLWPMLINNVKIPFLFWGQSYPVQALRQQDNRLRSPETLWPAWPEACSFEKVPKRSCLSKLLGISVNPETKNEGAKLWKKFSATVRPVGNSTSWYLAVHIPVESGLPWCWVQFITNDKLPVKTQLHCRNIQLFVYRDQRMKGLIIQQTQARRRKSLKPREVIIAFCAGWF